MSRHPEVKWAQRVEKVYITVQLPDSKDAKVDLTPDGLFTFSASAGAGDNQYEVKLELFDKVNVEESKINVGVRSIFCVVQKAEIGWWKRLLRAEGKPPHYVKVDWDKWVDEDEDEGGEPDLGGMDFSKFGGMGDDAMGGMGGLGGMGGMGGLGGMGGMGGMDFSKLAGMGGDAMGGMDFSKLGGMGDDAMGDVLMGVTMKGKKCQSLENKMLAQVLVGNQQINKKLLQAPHNNLAVLAFALEDAYKICRFSFSVPVTGSCLSGDVCVSLRVS